MASRNGAGMLLLLPGAVFGFGGMPSAPAVVPSCAACSPSLSAARNWAGIPFWRSVRCLGFMGAGVSTSRGGPACFNRAMMVSLVLVGDFGGRGRGERAKPTRSDQPGDAGRQFFRWFFGDAELDGVLGGLVYGFVHCGAPLSVCRLGGGGGRARCPGAPRGEPAGTATPAPRP